MFSLFKKKEAAAPPQQRLADCLQKKDYAGLAKAYYDMGRAAMDSGDPGRAMLWLSRADTIYSARDDVYEAVGDKLADDCSDRIGVLEEAPLLSNQIVEEIDDKRDGLGDARCGCGRCSPCPGWSRWGPSWPSCPAAGCWASWENAWTWRCSPSRPPSARRSSTS